MPEMATTDLTWVEQTQTVGVFDHALGAIEANPGWRLIAAGRDPNGQTTLTFGWPWPGSENCGCYTVCERPDACPQNSSEVTP